MTSKVRRVSALPRYRLVGERFEPDDDENGDAGEWVVYASARELLDARFADQLGSVGGDIEAVCLKPRPRIADIIRLSLWSRAAADAFGPAKAIRKTVFARHSISPGSDLADVRAVFNSVGRRTIETDHPSPPRPPIALARLWPRRGNHTFLIGIFVSTLCMLAAVRGADAAETFSALKNIDPLLAVISMSLILPAVFFRSVRWKIIYSGVGRLKISDAVIITLAGAAINNLLPARAGEIARGLMVRGINNQSAVAAFGSIIAERLLDVLTTVLFLAVGVIFLPETTEASWLYWGAIIFVAIAALLSIFVIFSDKISGPADRFGRPGAFVGNTAVSLASGIRTLASPKIFLKAEFFTICYWLTASLAFYITAEAFEKMKLATESLPFWWVILYAGMTNLGRMIPTAPASAGSYELAGVICAEAFGVDPSTALAFVLATHILQYIPPTALGPPAVLLWYRRTRKNGPAAGEPIFAERCETYTGQSEAGESGN